MNPQSQSLVLPGGMHIHLLRWQAEAPAEPPLLLVHGLGDSASVWHGVAPALARRADVVALDLRGHGRSGHAQAAGYTVAAMAQDLLAVADALGLEQPLLVGHSLGAGVAIRAAATAPRRFAALALVEYASDVAPTNVKLLRTMLARMHARYESVSDYAALLRRRHVLADPWLLDQVAQGALKPAAGAYLPRFDPAVLDALCDRDHLVATNALLARLALPVLLVRGALSCMVSNDDVAAVIAALPCAQLALVPMAGHSVPIDNPRGLLEAIERMFETAPAV